MVRGGRDIGVGPAVGARVLQVGHGGAPGDGSPVSVGLHRGVRAPCHHIAPTWGQGREKNI